MRPAPAGLAPADTAQLARARQPARAGALGPTGSRAHAFQSSHAMISCRTRGQKPRLLELRPRARAASPRRRPRRTSPSASRSPAASPPAAGLLVRGEGRGVSD